MRVVTKVQTSDGELHGSVEEAKVHAEKRYGRCLTDLAHTLVRIEKYVDMTEWLSMEENQNRMRLLMKLKQDCVLEERDDD